VILDKQQRSQLVALSYGLLLAIGAILVLMALSIATPSVEPTPSGPDPFAPATGNQAPQGGPTRFPRPGPTVAKESLIIQQNPQCWTGLPGVTCDPARRTYN